MNREEENDFLNNNNNNNNNNTTSISSPNNSSSSSIADSLGSYFNESSSSIESSLSNFEKKEIKDGGDLENTNKPTIITNDGEININCTKVDKRIAMVMLILGIGCMFPFQSFISSLDYFNLIYPKYKIGSTFPFIYMVLVCLTFVVLLKFQKYFKKHLVIIIGFSILIGIMILIPIINMDSKEPGSLITYLLTLLLIGICSIVDAFVQGTLFSIAASFGPQYAIYSQTGIGISGITVLITRLICKLSFPPNEKGSRMGFIIFFSISAFFIAFSLLSFLYALTKSYFRDVIIINKNNEIKKGGEDNFQTPQGENDGGVQEIQQTQQEQQHPFKFVFLKSYKFVLLVVLTFSITLFLFPGIVIQIKSNVLNIKSDWWIFIMVATYNTSDSIGKTIPIFLHSKWIPSLKSIWIMAIFRIIFIPLFFLSLYSIIKHESLIIIFISIFSSTNGYIASYALSIGPNVVDNQHKGICGTLMSCSLNCGLLLGSTLNLIIVSII